MPPDARMISQDASLFQYRVKMKLYPGLLDVKPGAAHKLVCFLIVQRPRPQPRSCNAFPGNLAARFVAFGPVAMEPENASS